MAFNRETSPAEAKVQWVSQKAYLLEFTLGGKYWVPKKCIEEMGEPDIDGNRVFEISEWWWSKKSDFEATD